MGFMGIQIETITMTTTHKQYRIIPRSRCNKSSIHQTHTHTHNNYPLIFALTKKFEEKNEMFQKLKTFTIGSFEDDGLTFTSQAIKCDFSFLFHLFTQLSQKSNQRKQIGCLGIRITWRLNYQATFWTLISSTSFPGSHKVEASSHVIIKSVNNYPLCSI
ncbi:hypothetical protein Droror1_Dr00006231 [Drosera rotundifolia]